MEKESDSLKKELYQFIKERDGAHQQQKLLEEAIIKTCSEIPDIKVCEEETLGEKVAKLDLTIRDSRNKFAEMKFEYEVTITELQMRLQPFTLLELRK